METWIPWLTALIPLPPLAAAAAILFLHPCRRPAAALALAGQALSLLGALAVFGGALAAGGTEGGPVRGLLTFTWFTHGDTALPLGVAADPLGASMLLMITFVGLLIFIHSIGYMREDPRFARFFCFLSLFSGAMLGVVAANSLLLLFICWELVGLASYLLIGFWFQKPSAAAAARKAFLTTRVGDLGLFLGLLWIYKETGTLLFYDGGHGLLEQSALTSLAGQTVAGGMALSTAVSLLLFCGAVGKSGQFPLHIWLPDAMEGPTPVSALIHAATMVAAGVYLVARVFPLFAAGAGGDGVTTALTVVAWTGAVTALFGAVVAVAQNDIKRILAYSTVSQLGFMMLALGAGGVAAGIFHLLAHAFFKALLFLGAGSVIHGCGHEQDIRKMGGLRKTMPVTFILYGIGMMALAGFPFLFSGFWSKEAILVEAFAWPVSRIPFLLALAAAVLTAFYMTRQMIYVFLGTWRGKDRPHESPRVMTLPLVPLAAGAVLLGFLATPAWPWFAGFLAGEAVAFSPGALFTGKSLAFMALSILVAATGVAAGWLVYARSPASTAEDPLQTRFPAAHRAVSRRLLVDEFYERTVLRLQSAGENGCARLDGVLRRVTDGAGAVLSRGLGGLAGLLDRSVLNSGFDTVCQFLRAGTAWLSSLHQGRAQNYLRFVGIGMVVLLLFYAWLQS